MEKGSGDERKNHQQRKGKGKMSENPMELPTHPPPHFCCPRCDSSHTKFCYYNNYTVTQPRYFCKTCRRYWTQGGTLRNVPVGGGSRRPRRDNNNVNNASSSSNGEGSSRSVVSSPPPPPPVIRNFSGMMGTLSRNFGTVSRNPAMRASSSAINPPVNSLYPGNGFMASLAGMRNLNLTPSQGLNRPLQIGGSRLFAGGNGFGNFSVPQDFNRPATVRPDQGRVQPIQPLRDFHNMISRGKEPMFPNDPIHQANNFANMNNRGKEPMFLTDPIHQVNNFANMNNRGKEPMFPTDPIHQANDFLNLNSRGKEPMFPTDPVHQANMNNRGKELMFPRDPIHQANSFEVMNNRGKEPMFPSDPFHQGNNFQEMNNGGKEPLFPFEQSFYQATRPMDFWNQTSFSNHNNIDRLSTSSSTSLWNISNGHTDDDADDVAGSSIDPNVWPDDLPDFDPPEL